MQQMINKLDKTVMKVIDTSKRNLERSLGENPGKRELRAVETAELGYP